jgi:predicted O-methyltransferase YrrM
MHAYDPPRMSDRLADLLAAGPELHSDDWSLSDSALALVVDAIEARPAAVVECGSGRSTIVIARLLREVGGTVHSLEHDPAWAESTRAQLAQEGLVNAEVITAPLEPHPLAGEAGGWYSRAAIARLPTAIGVLLIDGPPAGEPELQRNRHPALAELGVLLEPGATVILDDAGRSGETAAIELWRSEFGLPFQRDPRSGTATAMWPL